MGSGSLALANDPLFFMPEGTQVAGSKPWFCRKNMTRLGDFPMEPEAALAMPGSNGEATAAVAPLAIPCRSFLRFII